MIKNLILVYPSFERGGVKNNFLNYLKVFKKKFSRINIISDKKIFKEVKSDRKIKIYTVNSYKSDFIYKYLTSLIAAYKIYKLRKIDDKDNIRIISFQSSFFPSIICSILGLKLIIRISEDPVGATIYSDNFFSSFLVMLSKILTYNLSYKIFVNSEQMKLSTEKLIFNKKKIVLLHNMNLNFIRKYNISKKKNIFLNLGRFCKQKNQTIILKAFKLFVDNNYKNKFRLYLCGDGPDKLKLKNLSKRLNLTKYVRFYSWQKNTEIIFSKSKFFVFPSLYEGLPNALIEAVNNDLVCICTNVSGVKDICGKNYISINKHDHYKLFYKMKLAQKKYTFYTKKNKLNKSKLEKFLFKNLESKLLNNIK